MITSKTGAALHDILHVLKRRDPSLPVIIYPTAVQGDDAPGQIVRAIELANQRNECDVLIVGRGGGSLEDLWSFNDERVARAIFASRIPVVSAVGHETDVTIADFVADLRAPTPSAAAEVVSRNQQELLRQVQLSSSASKWQWIIISPTARVVLRRSIIAYSSSIHSSGWHASKPCLSACKSG